jgi:hypothetical protein
MDSATVAAESMSYDFLWLQRRLVQVRHERVEGAVICLVGDVISG